MKGLPRLLLDRWNKYFILVAIILLASLLCGQAQVPQIKIDEQKTAQLVAMMHRNQPKHISILHLGDSHLQAGVLPQAIRDLLNQRYPNSSMGLTVPYGLSRTNGPRNIRIESSVTWIAQKLQFAKQPTLVGVSGMILSRKDNRPYTFTLSSKGRPFDRVILFRTPQTPSLVSTIGHAFLSKGSQIVGNFVADTLTFSSPQTRVYLRNEEMPTEGASYGGFLLSNQKETVQYHAIGYNGAMYATFAHEGFIQQTKWLHPDWIVLSLGTNEAQARSVSQEVFHRQVMYTLRLLRRQNPKAKILLTTPPPSFRRNRLYNDQVEVVAYLLRNIAHREQLAFFDLYEALGCEEGASIRREEGDYYAYDGIHFTPNGYTHQGRLIGQAILGFIETH